MMDQNAQRRMAVLDLLWHAGEVGLSMSELWAGLDLAHRPVNWRSLLSVVDALTNLVPVVEDLDGRLSIDRDDRTGCPSLESLDRRLRRAGQPVDAWRARPTGPAAGIDWPGIMGRATVRPRRKGAAVVL